MEMVLNLFFNLYKVNGDLNSVAIIFYVVSGLLVSVAIIEFVISKRGA